jgi:hypothetical protein
MTTAFGVCFLACNMGFVARTVLYVRTALDTVYRWVRAFVERLLRSESPKLIAKFESLITFATDRLPTI